MLRVTPIYGSRFDSEGAAEAPSCTLVEYGGVRVLFNVGWWATAEGNSSTGNSTGNNDDGMLMMEEDQHSQHSQQPHKTTTTTTTTSSSFPPLPEHDCLVLTDSTLNALGGLPLYYDTYVKPRMATTTATRRRRGNAPKMYATFPTVKMGQMTLYDHHAAISLDGGRPPYTLEQMDDAFAQLQTIKYSQSIPMRATAVAVEEEEQAEAEKDRERMATSTAAAASTTKPSLSMTAHRAGHVVGGAFFVLKRLQDETTVVLTPPTYNIAKELHLDSAELLKYGANTDVLVTYPGGSAMKYISKLYHNNNKQGKNTNTSNKDNVMKPFATRQGATKHLLETILSVLRRDGHVLLPVDASGRVLELLLLLSQHWDRHRLGAAYNLVWLGPMVKNTLDFCQSQLEWMANQLGTQFDDSNTTTANSSTVNRRRQQQQQQQHQRSSSSESHPFALRNVQLCSSVQELDAVIRQNNNNPTCVLASGLTLDHGPARDLFLRWADNADHAVIFTDSSRCCLRQQHYKPGSGHDGNADPDDDGDTGTQKKGENNSSGGSSDNNNITTTASSFKQETERTGNSLVSAAEKKEQDGITTQMQRQTSMASGDYRISSSTTAAISSSAVETTTTAMTTDQQQQEEDDDNENTMMVGAALGPDQQASKYCAAAQLLQQWCLAKWERREMDDSIFIDVQVPHRTPLAGQELKAFLAQEEAKRIYQKKQEEQQAMLREVEIAKGQLRLGEDEATLSATTTSNSNASTNIMGGAITAKSSSIGASSTGNVAVSTLSSSSTSAANKSNAMSTTLKGRPKKKSRFDSSLFLKFSKPLHLTFEVREEAVGVGQNDSTAKYGIGEVRSGEVLEDDYGIAVIPEKFTDIVSGVDPSKFAGGTGRIGEEITKRGFGFGVAGQGVKGGTGGANVNDDEVGDLEDEMDEQALEITDLSEGNGIIRGRNGRTPTKVTTIPRRLEVLAEIAYVPLEGRVDARAARQSVRALQPRQVIVLGGKAKSQSDLENNDLALELVDEVKILAEAAQSFVTDRSSIVQTPSDGETAELSVGHAAYSVRLIDIPYQTREEKDKNMEKGMEAPEPEETFECKVGSCTVTLLDAVATGQKVASDGSIVLAPRALSKEIAMKHRPVYVSDGEVLLTDLRSELIAQGMKAEYSAHAGYSQLVINGKILVKKAQDSGRLEIEGPLCEDFYTARSMMCGQYATL